MEDEPLTREDRAHLEWSRVLARRGWGRVHPNPLVGCVVVREGRIVGEGFHREFGGPHAEIAALEAARSQAEGATVYVSLEPCNHEGKTPPCAKALIQAGVSRVVYGVAEPGETAGGGGDTLRAAGIEVQGPVWDDTVGRSENPSFFHARSRDTPYVALKLAMSMDARIASAAGEATRITGLEAEREVHRLRTGFDGVLVGAGTVRADDPRLTVRLVPPGRTAVRRLVLDPGADLTAEAALFQDAPEAPVHVFTRRETSELDIERLEDAGAHVHPVETNSDGRLELGAVLRVAGDIGIASILCEGGAALAGSLLKRKLAQRLYLFVAPKTLGPGAVPAFPDAAHPLDWSGFHPAFPPEAHGNDTLIVLDREAR
jgi:diaminohydroxyphosphoribosylaminopyrimidine deaminase / 5-amino-6-(5-phosphoribosylamino)uracil reductase